MRTEHLLPAYLIQRKHPVRILVVGGGGTGSAFVLGLPYLHQALLAWGHPEGLDVVLIDPDTVSRTNCVRQPFSEGDIGQNKAIVLIHRINQFWGMNWQAAPVPFGVTTLERSANWVPDLVVGCVDSKVARQGIHRALTKKRVKTTYWLDIGNSSSSGQYVLGQPLNSLNRKAQNRLPTVAEKYPEIVDPSTGEDTLPSCSALESLDRQEPLINQSLAMLSLAMLSRLLRYGRLSYHGAFFNAASGQTSPIPISSGARNARRKAAA